ncbi:olfactory receptor 6C70-like [Ambystoma mexicanum]|uniref:olfactory receptor 6C70-like n=1 Tax=Ambystoma mexicanum TaxID=8296 RepID=UPI0037E77F0A
MVFVLLPIMSVDRYVAICNPLRYATIMNNRLCIQLVIGSWLASLLYISGPTVIITRLPFCGPNVINHFFCDSAALMHLACVDTGFIELVIGLISMVMLICSLALTILSYTFIICTVLKIPVTGGRGKTFSTCSSHLVMVTIAYGSSIFIEVSPALNPSIELYKSVNMFSSFISPLMNPLVYTFKNNQFKEAFRTLLRR